MASPTPRSVVLLPIQPRYANPILDGVKRVEFRKRAFRREVSHVVVYSSSPVKQVVGFFEILGIDEAPPAQLWSRYSHVGAILKEDYDRYFSRCDDGVAIRVGKVHVFKKPFPLGDISPELRAPQSYAYLSPHAFTRIRGRRALVT